MTAAPKSIHLQRWRGRELALLVFPCAILLAGLLAIDLARHGLAQAQTWQYWAAFVGLVLSLHVWLSWRYPASDQTLLPLGATLCAIGLVMTERLVPELAPRQLLWLGTASTIMVISLTLLPSVGWLHQWTYLSALLGLGLVAVTFLFGIDPNDSGARLWLGVAGVYFQPSEILKLLLVVFLAAYLDQKQELVAWGRSRWGPLHLPPLPHLAPLLVMLGLSLAAVILQRDLGAGLLLFSIFLALLYAASGRVTDVLLGLGAFLLGGLLMTHLFSHVRARVDIWLDPWADPQNQGYQIIQALIALAAGGVLGSGLTFGYPRLIPAVHTDFVIAAIGEELGLAGTLGTVALYMLWVQRGLSIALACRGSFAALLATGLTATIGLQALIILGGTLRLIPLTGITLPFISYGGSSLLVNTLMLGLLLAISAEERSPRHG